MSAHGTAVHRFDRGLARVNRLDGTAAALEQVSVSRRLRLMSERRRLAYGFQLNQYIHGAAPRPMSPVTPVERWLK